MDIKVDKEKNLSFMVFLFNSSFEVLKKPELWTNTKCAKNIVLVRVMGVLKTY